jgi:oligoribonuclease NrnB/cAMP/cGMP phosphodiesterase (DHH superfamily)
LDHHKTAKAVVDAFGANGAFGDETNDPGVCGAVLAYRHVWLPLKNHNHAEIVKTVENFARLAGIRDTWQKNSPDWNEACYQSEALVFWPEDELIGLNPLEWSEKLSLGKILFKRKIDWAKQCVEGSYRFISNSGTKVIIFEGTKASSDSSEIIGNEADLVVGFNTFVEDEKIKVIYSTRSRAEFNCAEFCKSLGGGGHTKAAGFGITISPIDPHPFYLFQNILNKYEKSQNTKVVDL